MYTLYKFHFLNGISEINQLFDDILIIWPAPVYIQTSVIWPQEATFILYNDNRPFRAAQQQMQKINKTGCVFLLITDFSSNRLLVLINQYNWSIVGLYYGCVLAKTWTQFTLLNRC